MDSLQQLTSGQLHYLNMLQALLPPGPAWDKSFCTYNPDGSVAVPQSNLTNLLSGLAIEFDRCDQRINTFISECNPLTVLETIYAKYAEAGLPDNCSQTISPSVALMRQEILTRWQSVGGANISFFQTLLNASGYSYTLTEYFPLVAGGPCTAPCSNLGWQFTLGINIHGVNETWFSANTSNAGDYLHSWSNSPILCYLNKIKPAHVNLYITLV
jgi:uncharacterized protein YmfQ (DUF2313 family)